MHCGWWPRCSSSTSTAGRSPKHATATGRIASRPLASPWRRAKSARHPFDNVLARNPLARQPSTSEPVPRTRPRRARSRHRRAGGQELRSIAVETLQEGGHPLLRRDRTTRRGVLHGHPRPQEAARGGLHFRARQSVPGDGNWEYLHRRRGGTDSNSRPSSKLRLHRHHRGRRGLGRSPGLGCLQGAYVCVASPPRAVGCAAEAR
jgi:hypothetical protein